MKQDWQSYPAKNAHSAESDDYPLYGGSIHTCRIEQYVYHQGHTQKTYYIGYIQRPICVNQKLKKLPAKKGLALHHRGKNNLVHRYIIILNFCVRIPAND